MTPSPPARCSALAEELDEPLGGTVDWRPTWLLVEDRSAWGSHAVRDVLGADFEAEAKEQGIRLQLVRRRDSPPAADAPRRVFRVDPLSRTIATRTVADLAELRLADALLPAADFGEPLPGPMFLVCTNGRRDACCALRGRAVLAALDSEDAWECTHLGGHRFAANLVCLPDGVVYGRVLPADAPRLVAAYRDGRLDPELMRGRSLWPAFVQVAEIELRRRLGLAGVSDLELVDASDPSDEAAWAVFRTLDGATHRLDLRSERLAQRATSCRPDALEQPVHWHVEARG